jgi:hypothetical protein
MKFNSILILIILSVLCGCTASQNVKNYPSTYEVHFDKTSTMAVLVAEDAIDASSTDFIVGSGRSLSRKTTAILLKKFDKVELLGVNDLEKAFIESQKKNAIYLVSPVIVDWEDSNTPMSGLRDRIEVQISVYSVQSRSLLHKVSYQAVGTYWVLTNYTPLFLLNQDFQTELLSVFEGK